MNIEFFQIHKHCGSLCIVPLILDHTISLPVAGCKASRLVKYMQNVAHAQNTFRQLRASLSQATHARI